MASSFNLINLLFDISVLLMIEKGLRGEISHSVHQHLKANNKSM